ncbi:hypothetical protein RYX56_17010 [Alkalihalophilus lindianensis]|uniref:Uncharacterized protein n=1 Tax=Alkalihalophilus lindianensis TaxID=1630542 RepID=A0ABU3XDV1_9BACI|nr:hypothetical protein [Alkalihalophilus lindianensis]MDV2686070.1 hypothetical protein [Alkalihalophilus lindianensis]
MTNKREQEIPEVMEKGLQQSHGISHQEYLHDLDKKIEVEKAREKDYQKNKELEKELNNKLSR